jgi:hypothetical protein
VWADMTRGEARYGAEEKRSLPAHQSRGLGGQKLMLVGLKGREWRRGGLAACTKGGDDRASEGARSWRCEGKDRNDRVCVCVCLVVMVDRIRFGAGVGGLAYLGRLG